VPNVTAHPSTASVPITVLLYDGPLLCGFNVAIKGLIDYIAADAAVSLKTRYQQLTQTRHSHSK